MNDPAYYGLMAIISFQTLIVGLLLRARFRYLDSRRKQQKRMAELQAELDILRGSAERKARNG